MPCWVPLQKEMVMNTKNYCVYQPNQALSAQDLNGSFNYLELDGRETRNRTIGCGVQCGLTVEYAGDSVIVHKGTAITSAGYLLTLSRDYTFDKYQPFTDSQGYFKGLLEQGSRRSFVCNELIAAEEQGGTSLSAEKEGWLRQFTIAAFLDIADIDSTTCVADHCDIQGRRRDLSWRMVLIPRMVAAPMRLHELKADYLIGDIKEPLHLIRDLTFDVLLGRLSVIRTNGYAAVQYLYDYLDLVLRAYNEFAEAIRVLSCTCVIDAAAHPRHVLLGCGDYPENRDPLRHYFTAVCSNPEHGNARGIAELLYSRLMSLLRNGFLFDKPSSAHAVRLTSERRSTPLLESRAIPLYSDYSVLNPLWSMHSARTWSAEWNRSYHCFDNADPAMPPAISDPFGYSLETLDFLRLEGHIGRSRANVETTLNDIRRANNLPFTILAVRIDTPLSASDAKNLASIKRCNLNRARKNDHGTPANPTSDPRSARARQW